MIGAGEGQNFYLCQVWFDQGIDGSHKGGIEPVLCVNITDIQDQFMNILISNRCDVIMGDVVEPSQVSCLIRISLVGPDGMHIL